MNKRRGEANTLLWKDEVDFVRLAARCGAVIVPFGALGADDAFDLYMDTTEILAHPVLGPMSRAIMDAVDTDASPEESVMPITKVPGTPLPAPIPLSNLGRVYFQFGQPLDLSDLDVNDADACAAAYGECKARVEAEIEALKGVRAADPDREALSRLRSSAGRMLETMTQSYSR